jgi:hypothetical protein
MLNRVYRIVVRGQIDYHSFDRLRTKFDQYSWVYKPVVIAVSIDSTSGSLIQTKNITQFVHNKARKYGVPVYTFAEDACLSSANVLLTSGHKVYASNFLFSFLQFAHKASFLGLQ